MIYRYHIYDNVQNVHENVDADPDGDRDREFRHLTGNYLNDAQALLDGFPEKLQWVLNDAEIHNEIVDPEKQEAYLKIITDLDESQVSQAVTNTLRVSGLLGTRLL